MAPQQRAPHQGWRIAVFTAGIALTAVAIVMRGTLLLAIPIGAVLCLAAAPFSKELAWQSRWFGRFGLKKNELQASALVAEAPSQERDEIQRSLGSDEIERAKLRHIVASAAVERLLCPEQGPLAGCEFRLYTLDADRERLLPIFEPDHLEESEGWKIGQGVTGEAWRREEYVSAYGTECSDATYRLTSEQQQRYKDLVAVSSAPVLNAAGRMIAALSASSKDPNTSLNTPDAVDEHVALARAMARVLVDLLQYDNDG